MNSTLAKLQAENPISAGTFPKLDIKDFQDPIGHKYQVFENLFDRFATGNCHWQKIHRSLSHLQQNQKFLKLSGPYNSKVFWSKAY